MIYAAVFHPIKTNRVEGVRSYAEQQDVPQGSVLVSNWNSVGPAPFEGAEMRQENGVLFWQDSRTLEELRTAKWNKIKVARQAAIDSPLVTPYGAFDCGPLDRTNITDAIALMQTMQSIGTPTTVDFTVMDNTTVTLTTAQMVNVGLLLGSKVQAAYARGRFLRNQINNATIPELDSVTW